MTEGLKFDLGSGPFIAARPSTEMSASEAVLRLLTGPLKTFSDRVDSMLADQNRRIAALEKTGKGKAMRGPMMLRTAETESRIAELEQAVNRIMRHLGLEDDNADVPLPGVQLPDGGGADSGPVGQPAAELSELRREGDEPRVQAASHRGKRRG
jgi:hypothetical protein